MYTSTSIYLEFQFDSGSAAPALGMLTAAIDAAPIESALLRSAPGVELDAAIARALIARAQEKGIAMLVASSAGDAAKLGADGVHVLWTPDIGEAFKTQRQAAPKSIVGADAGRSRHDAMELGDAGADYVAFGIPPHVEDRAKAAERQRDLIVWWSELFEIPCVAFDVPDSGAAHQLAGAGADFVSVRVTSSEPGPDAAARVREFSEALRMPESAE